MVVCRMKPSIIENALKSFGKWFEECVMKKEAVALNCACCCKWNYRCFTSSDCNILQECECVHFGRYVVCVVFASERAGE